MDFCIKSIINNILKQFENLSKNLNETTMKTETYDACFSEKYVVAWK